MLQKLAGDADDLWPNDPEKRETILKKYKDYQIPVRQTKIILIDLIDLKIRLSSDNLERRDRLDWSIARRSYREDGKGRKGKL